MSTTVFSPAQLQAIVDAGLVRVPDGHTNALVGTVDATGAQVIATFKLGPSNNWDVTAAGRHEWTGDNEVGASVIYSW